MRQPRLGVVGGLDDLVIARARGVAALGHLAPRHRARIAPLEFIDGRANLAHGRRELARIAVKTKSWLRLQPPLALASARVLLLGPKLQLGTGLVGEVALRADGVSAGGAGTDSHPQPPALRKCNFARERVPKLELRHEG